jgi:hypothetical protein
MYTRLILASILVFILLVTGGCTANPPKYSSSFDDNLKTIVQPYSFDFARWELNTLYNQLKHRITGSPEEEVYTSQSVVRYFSYMVQMNSLKSSMQMLQAGKIQGDIALYEANLKEVEAQITALKPITERTIARQIGQILNEQGIYHPFGDNWFKYIFPPVYFKLEDPLYILVISPRDKIERVRDITIKQDIVTADMEQMESALEKLDMSALVVQIGGLGATYPSFVVNNADLRFTIDVAVEEWLHQYLSFKPLGFRYVLNLLGISHDPAIPTINETVAGIASQELGAMIYDRFYSQYKTENDKKESLPVGSQFDFNAAMRETRQTVDHYLASGQIEEAEKYMQNRRQFLASNGYYIRKLNQAYFAFYGSYAHSASSVDPVGGQIKLLKEHSLNVKDFLDTTSRIKNQDDLNALINYIEKQAQN